MTRPTSRRLRQIFPILVAGIAIALPGIAFAATLHVTINNYAFAPAALTVHPGDTVIWTNRDDVTHTVTARNKQFSSGLLAPGKSFSFVFHQPGTYAYICAVHPFMRGSVTVR